jgi:ERCC4-type nuclease
MILIDYRAGTGQGTEKRPPLVNYIQPQSLVSVGDYDADVSFLGNGPDGPLTVPVAIEYKKIDDILKCVNDGRFSGEQLPKMLQSFGTGRLYVLIEGAYRVDPLSGILEIRQWDYRLKKMCWKPAQLGRDSWLYRQLDNWITTFEEMVEHDFGVRLTMWRTWSIEESAAWIKDKYVWWTSKPFEQHKSHIKWASKDHRLRAAKAMRQNVLVPQRTADLPLVQRMSAELPVVGPERSVEVARRFASPFEMVMAGEKDWQEIKGIGRTGARRIVAALQGGETK